MCEHILKCITCGGPHSIFYCNNKCGVSNGQVKCSLGIKILIKVKNSSRPPTVGQWSADGWLTVDRLSVHFRLTCSQPSFGQVPANCRLRRAVRHFCENLNFQRTLHLPVALATVRIHWPDCKIHQPQASGHDFLCTLTSGKTSHCLRRWDFGCVFGERYCRICYTFL